MAEEEKDSWLEDFEDDDDAAGELDQSDIDSLLAGDAVSPPASPESEDNSLGELDQSDIDSLLSGGVDANAGSAPEGGAEESSDGELDQSDIDSLLAGDDDDFGAANFEADDDSSVGELDQSDIDSLLSGDSSATDTEFSTADSDDSDINQADIDALLSGEADSDDEATEISPDQEEIDRLFSESDDQPAEDDPFQAEEIDFQDIFDDTEGEDSFLSTSNEFDDEEFALEAEIPDIPDIPGDDDETAILTKENESNENFDENIFDELDAETVLDGQSTSARKFKIPEIPLPPILQERKNQAIAGGILAAIIVALVFLFSGGDDTPQYAETPPEEEIMAPTTPPPTQVQQTAAVNTAPMIDDLNYLLETAGPLTILLEAKDAEGDDLSYEVLTEPEHGKLSGKPPYLIYTPNKDFPGEDIFNFRVNDGQDFSPPAIVKISGDMAKIAAAEEPEEAAKKKAEQQEPKSLEPREILIAAKDIAYNVPGGKSFYLDWEHVWEKANYLPFTEQVAVEVLSDGLRGKLKKMNNHMHRYEPQKYAAMEDKIRYRFKLGRKYSKIRTVSLQVDPGNPAPEIRLQPIAASYNPGEMVLLDASASLDEDRDSLIFSWQQIAGVPVQMEALDQQGAKISFIVPSSFSNTRNAGPLIRLTAIDKSGKQDVMDIKISTKSRRGSALWGGVANR